MCFSPSSPPHTKYKMETYACGKKPASSYHDRNDSPWYLKKIKNFNEKYDQHEQNYTQYSRKEGAGDVVKGGGG